MKVFESRRKLTGFCAGNNFPFGALWQGNHYSVKQVAPVIKEESDEIVVITVYTFYF